MAHEKSSIDALLPRQRAIFLTLSALLCAALVCGALGNIGRFSEHWAFRTQMQQQNRIYYTSTCVNMTVKADIPLEARRFCDQASLIMNQSPFWKASIDTLDSINVFKDGYALSLMQSVVWTLLLPLVFVSIGGYVLWTGLRTRLTGGYALSSQSCLLPQQNAKQKQC